MKILLVEDEPFMLEAISSVIENAGYEVVKVNNAADAKKQIDAEAYAMVLTDIYLPGPDGFGIVKYIKENPKTKNIPVVVVTGMVDEREKVALKIIPDDWLSKPFSLEQLLRVMKKFMPIEA